VFQTFDSSKRPGNFNCEKKERERDIFFDNFSFYMVVSFLFCSVCFEKENQRQTKQQQKYSSWKMCHRFHFTTTLAIRSQQNIHFNWGKNFSFSLSLSLLFSSASGLQKKNHMKKRTISGFKFTVSFHISNKMAPGGWKRTRRSGNAGGKCHLPLLPTFF